MLCVRDAGLLVPVHLIATIRLAGFSSDLRVLPPSSVAADGIQTMQHPCRHQEDILATSQIR